MDAAVWRLAVAADLEFHNPDIKDNKQFRWKCLVRADLTQLDCRLHH